MKEKANIDKQMISASMIMAFASCFLLMIYAPLEAYFTNKDGFWFDFYGLIGVMLISFFLGIVFVFLILFFSGKYSKKIYRILFSAGSILYFYLWIEGTFLAGDLPILDGRDINWGDFVVHRILSALVPVLLLIGLLVLLKKLGFDKTQNLIKYGQLFISGMLFITMISLAVMNNGLEKKERRIINKNHQFEYSTDQNLLILILDSVDGAVFDEVLERHPEYYEEFKDFTYFDNMLSNYTQTDVSVSYMMTWDGYEDPGDFYEYATAAYDKSPFLDLLEQRKYRIGMYIADFIPAKSERVYRFENVIKDGMGGVNFWEFLRVEAKMVGYRYAPFELKRFCKVNMWSFMTARRNYEKENHYSDKNEDFYKDLLTEQITYTEDKVFKLQHIEGAHVPFRHDADVKVVEEGSYEQSIEASFTIANAWLKKLKEAGVYDNSAIMIMADHGFSKEDIPEGRLHPVFFVKGIDQTGDRMEISKAPVSFEDFPTAFPRLMDGVESNGIFDWKDGDARDRNCRFLSYHDLMLYLKSIQHGYAGDIDSLEIIDERAKRK